MITPLGAPTEAEARLQLDAVRDWVAAWRKWQAAGQVVWCDRRWRNLGLHSLPEKLALDDANSVASWIGEEQRWERALSRYQHWVSRWPTTAARLPRYFDELAGYSDQDMLRLKALVGWLEANPRSHLYPRQIPISGMDSKWLEARSPMVADLVGAIQRDDRARPFYERCGLRQPPHTVRLRLLDTSLREQTGGLGDITAPIEQIANLPLSVSKVYIVENVQTGLCFEERPGSVVFMGLGYGIRALARAPWLAGAECFYWGDLDTHGFAILNGARSCLPNVASVLMDEATLLRNRDLWVEEKEQYGATELPLLTSAEQRVYQGLKQQRWGLNVRLEQERIAWNEAWEVLAR